MIAKDRQRRLLHLVRERGAASVVELAAEMRVSQATVRRDLVELDANGELVRTYGGAVVSAVDEKPFHVSSIEDFELKDAVAERAAALVPDGAVVLLDIGTTTPLLARRLRGRPVTVITGNLGVLDELRDDDAVKLVLLGGVLRRNYQSLVGTLTENALRQLNADLFFLTCTGVRPNGHVVDDMAVETPIKQAMVQSATQVVLLAPETKFPGTGTLRVTTLEEVDVLVTTSGAPERSLSTVLQSDGKVIIA